MENNNENEPIILGVLRKEKSSKPFLAVFILVIILSVCFGLPYIEDYLKDSDNILGTIYDMFLGEKESTDRIVITNDSMHILNEKTVIPFNLVILSNVSMQGKTISYSLKVKTNTINLDETTYYLEVYGSNNNLLERVKLTGNIGTNEESRIHTFKDLNFNSGTSYYGRIQELKEDDYQAITLNSDESGVADINCVYLNNTYQYIFDNHKLKNIRHTFNYTDIKNIDLYLEKYNESNNKTKKINNLEGGTSKTEETNNGYTFTSNLDLNKFKKELMEEYIDYNYYELDASAKKINYEMKAKGYTCK